MKSRLLILTLICLLVACEKDINPQIDQQAPKLVVDAQIENGQAPVVVLSSSIEYFSSIDTNALYASYVHNAKVTLTNAGKSVVLKEFNTTTGGIRVYFYSTDIFSGNFMIGSIGQSYKLTIEAGGKTYTASTTIPVPAKTLDSLWWKKIPNRPDTGSQVVLMGHVTDPPGLGNYIRYFTKVNREPYFAGYVSVYDDQIVDGKKYDIQIDRGFDKNDELDPDNYGFFKKGDTVTVRFSNIDRASFDFWRTWEYSFQSVGNPFSSPGVIIGNISNDALGAFCGYGSLYKTLIIPK